MARKEGKLCLPLRRRCGSMWTHGSQRKKTVFTPPQTVWVRVDPWLEKKENCNPWLQKATMGRSVERETETDTGTSRKAKLKVASSEKRRVFPTFSPCYEYLSWRLDSHTDTVMDRPNIFEALVTCADAEEDRNFDLPTETRQALAEDCGAETEEDFDEQRTRTASSQDHEQESGDDETSDEEFIPPEPDAESPSDDEPDLENDEEEVLSQSGDEQEAPPDYNTYTAKDGTRWSKVPVTGKRKTPSKNISKRPPSQVPGTQNVHDLYDSYKLFISDKIIKDTVRFTNLYGQNQYQEKWQDCDDVEIEALIGVLLFLGIKKQNMLSTSKIWDREYGVSLVRAAMSRDRFKVLMCCLRFDDKSTRSNRRAKDAFAPFRDVWDEFNKNLSTYYIAGPLLTVDEQLVPFRGRCNFIQYLPSKPDRYGLKVFWVADSANNFPLLGIPYLGRPLGQDRQVNLGRNTAIQLATPFFKTGRNITCDNYFTDLALAEGCQNNGLTVVGTVRSNKRFLPYPFKSNRSLPLHGSEFVYNNTATLVNYQGKRRKNTVLLSSMHDEGIVKPGAPKQKPEIVLFYNETKGAVDSLDKLAHAYTSKRISKRWPCVMFANIIDLATVAARCVWSIKFEDDSLAKKDARSAFIQCISKSLMLPHMKRRLMHRNMHRGTLDLLKRSIKRIELESEGRKMPRTKTVRQDRSETERSGEAASTLRKRQASSDPGTSRETAPTQRKKARCLFCSWKADRKVRQRCQKCGQHVCPDHMQIFCPSCACSK